MLGGGINKLTLLMICLTLVSLSNSFLYESYTLKDEDLDAVKFYLYQRYVVHYKLRILTFKRCLLLLCVGPNSNDITM